MARPRPQNQEALASVPGCVLSPLKRAAAASHSCFGAEGATGDGVCTNRRKSRQAELDGGLPVTVFSQSFFEKCMASGVCSVSAGMWSWNFRRSRGGEQSAATAAGVGPEPGTRVPRGLTLPFQVGKECF